MVVALDLRIFDTTQLKEFNAVRIYLQVMFLSDLIYLRTNKVKCYYIEGRRDQTTESSFNWPESHPLKKAFRRWKKFISAVSILDGLLTTIISTIQGETHKNVGVSCPPRVKFDPPHKRWFEEYVYMIKLNAVIPVLF